MATIVATFGTGLSGLTPSGSGTPTLAVILRDIADDLTALRTPSAAVPAKIDTDHTALNAEITSLRACIVGIVAKLDLDAGVTDTNYTSLWTPAAFTAALTTYGATSVPAVLKTIKG